MSSAVANLVKGAAQTAHAHVAALLATTQVKPGDKLPLKETVKEADATKPITLAPSGKNIFVRTILYMRFGSLRPRPRPPSLFLLVIMHKLLNFFSRSLPLRPFSYPIIIIRARNRLVCLEPSRPRVIRRRQDTSKSTTSSRRRASTRSTSSP
jgi:hypothetical protein